MRFTASLIAATLLAPVPAFAQDVVVMRRTVAPPRIAEAPSRSVGTWKVGDAVATPGCSAAQPTQAPVTCRDSSDNLLGDSHCTAAKPSGAGTGPDYSTCAYKWATGVYSTPTPSCSTSATRTRAVSCVRQDPQLTPAATGMCDPTSPDAKTSDGPVAYYGGCTYTAGGWTQGSPSSTCSKTATRPETATTCARSGGSVPTTATLQECSGAGVAVKRNSAPYEETSGCTYTGTYSTTYSACTNDTQTAPLLSCSRSDGTPAENSKCAPAASRGCSPCETAAGNRWTGKFINGNTSYRTHTLSINSYEEFQSACAALSKQYGVGACFFSASSSNGHYIYPANALYYEQYSWITFANRPELIAANCGQ